MANNFRRKVQIAWAALSNAYIPGFLKGSIYTGGLKAFCVPGLNCYSCPGSFGSCPIGSLQAVISSPKYSASFLLMGFFLIAGALIARLACGFLCPFGLFQEIIYANAKIPLKVKQFKGDRILRLLKYAVALVFVFGLPMLAMNVSGSGIPWFCKWLCPAGALEAGIPLAILNPGVRGSIGMLFYWKLTLLCIVIIMSAVVYRAFCRYLCPLGAIYGLFNSASFYQGEIDEGKCTNCLKCESACPMAVKVRSKPNDPECIRCGVCSKACPSGALKMGFSLKSKGAKANQPL